MLGQWRKSNMFNKATIPPIRMRRRQADLSTRLIAYGTLGGTWLVITATAAIAISQGASASSTLALWCAASAIYADGLAKSRC